jgi:hypothetical protein
MPVGALSSARDLRSNLSNPSSSSRQNAISGSSTAREKDRKGNTLQPYIPTAAAAIAAAAAAAADVVIPSVPSLNLAVVNSNAAAVSRPAAAASATKPLSDAAALDQGVFLKQVRMCMRVICSSLRRLTLLVPVVKSLRARDRFEHTVRHAGDVAASACAIPATHSPASRVARW